MEDVDSVEIEDRWCALAGAAQATSRHLYNASKFRLCRVAVDDAAVPPIVTLQLGITDYKTSIGTSVGLKAYASRLNVDLPQLPDDGIPSEAQRQQLEPLFSAVYDGLYPFLAGCLGVEALVVTKDQKAPLFKRSEHVAELAGWYCCPGGHPEPGNLYHHEGQQNYPMNETIAANMAEWFSRMNSDLIVREIFDSAIHEVVDELGVDKSSLFNLGIHAVNFNMSTMKPDLSFIIYCDLESSELESLFNQRNAKESFESEPGSILFVDITRAEEIERSLNTCRITPPSAACLASVGGRYAVTKCGLLPISAP
jgi:hypothetical protein